MNEHERVAFRKDEFSLYCDYDDEGSFKKCFNCSKDYLPMIEVVDINNVNKRLYLCKECYVLKLDKIEDADLVPYYVFTAFGYLV